MTLPYGGMHVEWALVAIERGAFSITRYGAGRRSGAGTRPAALQLATAIDEK